MGRWLAEAAPAGRERCARSHQLFPALRHTQPHTHRPPALPAPSWLARSLAAHAAPAARTRAAGPDPAPARPPPPGMEYFMVPAQKVPSSLQHFRKSEKEVIGGLCRWVCGAPEGREAAVATAAAPPRAREAAPRAGPACAPVASGEPQQ